MAFWILVQFQIDDCWPLSAKILKFEGIIQICTNTKMEKIMEKWDIYSVKCFVEEQLGAGV